jgi:phage replication-related protein YjqB (UPF0714/DUF867 family)
MSDKYAKFEALASGEPDGSYAVIPHDIGSRIVVAAPHGGGIEPGTSEIARAIAGTVFSCYLFEGKKASGNSELHITSSNFDEPKCLSLLRRADIVLTVHGEDSESDVAFLGGRHTAAAASVRAALEQNGFTVKEHTDPCLRGIHPQNICNVGRMGAGVQLELSVGLRKSLFRSLSRTGRKEPKPRLAQFADLVRQALQKDGI